MTLDALGREAVLAVDAVRSAVQLTRSVHRADIDGLVTKADASPATIADFAVQALLIASLERDFKGDIVVAEEDAASLECATDTNLRDRVIALVRRQKPDASPAQVLAWIDRGRGECGARFWVLDPIDGTKGFLRGEQYAIAVALVEDGVAQLGILACPRLSGTIARDSASASARRPRPLAWTARRSTSSLRRVRPSSCCGFRRIPATTRQSGITRLDRCSSRRQVGASPASTDGRWISRRGDA
jgi:3'-phosphoadenosine 5'-phosphosulfate (PAPS) 3'-phosphatase